MRPEARRPPSAWLSLSAYARVYGVHRATVAKWLTLGTVLETYRVGRCLRIRRQPPRDPREGK